MTEPRSIPDVAGLMEKLDKLDTLNTVERGLLWAMINAAKDVLEIVEVQPGASFHDFDNCFVSGKAEYDAAGSPSSHAVMIIR